MARPESKRYVWVTKMPQNPLILAVETSGRTGSVAMAAGPELLGQINFSGPMKHAAELFPAVQQLLQQFNRKACQIGHIYISVGPGSFTGLRIAVTTAKLMHLAGGVKIVAVDSLDCIAANTANLTQSSACSNSRAAADRVQINRIAIVLDAKRGRFFTAVYERHSLPAGGKADTSCSAEPSSGRNYPLRKICPDCLLSAGEFLKKFASRTEPLWLLGEGLMYHKEKFKAEGIRFFDEKFWAPTAANIHLLGWHLAEKGCFTQAVELTPRYLRKAV